jgi:Protein of unknown function (DUF3106)
MILRLRYLGMVGLAATLLYAGAAGMAGDEGAQLRRSPRGSLARQKLLKLKLQRIAGGPLETALKHNREAWEGLTPDQRQVYRESFLAFLKRSPEKQDELLKRYETLFSMSAERRMAYRRRAEWLAVVAASFTEAQREELRKMAPDERARRIVDRKRELIREGRLIESASESQPSSAPTSAPASSD